MEKQVIKADVPETAGPFNMCVRYGDMFFISGLPPFDPQSGEIKPVVFEEQCERVLAQLKQCLEAAGSSLAQVIKCNVYCVPGPDRFSVFNAAYDRYFPKDAPSRIFMFIHSWPGPFDIEMDCVAAV